jgi:short-subunit dehydrogenase
LGKAFAKECASRGWDLFLTDLSEAKLALLAQGLERLYGIQALYAPCNLVDPEERALFWDRLAVLGIKFDMLINVAGLDYEGALLDRKAEEINTIIRLNIEATVSMTRHMVETQANQSRMHIINVSSLAGFYPMPLKAVYAASKRFLLDFSRAMRQELRSENIRVLALCPAGMATKPDTINSIDSQGWMGQITTLNTGTVAAKTINRALANQSVYIPGVANQVMHSISALLPADWVARMIHRRWAKTREIANQYAGEEDMQAHPAAEATAVSRGA